MNSSLAQSVVSACIAMAIAGCDRGEIRTYRVAKEPRATPVQMASDPHAGLDLSRAPNLSGTGQPGGAATFDAPANWAAQARTSMREASFAVEGEGGVTADVSLIILRGQAGDVLANVNRWLSQLGQPAISPERLSSISEKRSAAVGEVVVVDLEGLAEGGDPAKDGRILGAIAARDGETWFFKMRGNAALVGGEKQRFLEWVRSAKPTGDAGVADKTR